MALTDLMTSVADSAYYDEGFRVTLEDHVTYLYNLPETTINTVSAMDLHVFEFDFYGMLTDMGVPPELHYITMRMAGLSSPQDPFNHLSSIRVPPKGTISKMLGRYKAQNKI